MTVISQKSSPDSKTKTPPSSRKNSPIPSINVSPAQEKLDSLLQQESEFVFTSPTNSTFPTAVGNDRGPKFPSSVHFSTATAQHQDIGTRQEVVPTYEHTAIDMPPSYQKSLKSTSNRKLAPKPLILNSVEPEEPWPITKKLFFLGFFFWPLWFVGMGFSVFGKEPKTRTWGKRCACNSVIVAIIFAYLVAAYIQTGGRLLN